MKIADYGKAITSYIQSPTKDQKEKTKLLAEVDFSGMSVPALKLYYERETGLPPPEDPRELIIQLKRLIKGFDEEGVATFSKGGRVHLADGTPPPRKPKELKDLYKKIDTAVLAVRSNTVPPEFIVPNLEKLTQEYISDGLISGEDARKFALERKDYYDNFISENAGETVPAFDFDNEGKAIELSKEQITERINEADGGRIGLKKSYNPNEASLAALQKINEAGAERVTAKVNRFKELVKKGKSPNEAKKIVIQEFNLERAKTTGTPKWMTRGKTELKEEGVEFIESKRGPEPSGENVKEKAQKKRTQVIGEGQAFEERIKKEKTKTGFGKKFETAHTANIFQAKKLGIEYPVDALAIQATKVNQEVAEILNEELEPLYKKQLNLVKKLKKNNTFALRKELDELNRLISDTVATGGKQGKIAANVLKPIIVDPETLKGKILNLGFKTSDEVFTLPGATTKSTKAGTIADIMARANIKENVLSKASEIDRPEKAKLADKFKMFGKYAKQIAKPVSRVVGPFIPVAGTAATLMGVADTAKAAEQGYTSGDELAAAYLFGPEAAKGLDALKDKVRGQKDETEEFIP